MKPFFLLLIHFFLVTPFVYSETGQNEAKEEPTVQDAKDKILLLERDKSLLIAEIEPLRNEIQEEEKQIEIDKRNLEIGYRRQLEQIRENFTETRRTTTGGPFGGTEEFIGLGGKSRINALNRKYESAKSGLHLRGNNLESQKERLKQNEAQLSHIEAHIKHIERWIENEVAKAGSFQSPLTPIERSEPTKTIINENVGANLKIHKAFYGGRGTFVDVRSHIEGNVHNGSLMMSVGNHTLGGDPIFGVPKALHIRYENASGVYEAVVQEGDTIRIPDPTHSRL